MILYILAAALLVPYSIILVFFRTRWRAMSRFRSRTTDRPGTTVSVIIPARNESGTIERCLQGLLTQDYSSGDWEIIVVDDQSQDDTAAIILRMDHPRIKRLRIADGEPGGKKAALARGIEHARGDLILTTDADCVHPVSWIRTMAAYQALTGVQFIAAPVRIADTHTGVGIFQSLDFLSLQGITGAAVHSGWLQMSNGANLGFTKAAFAAVNGYTGIDRIATGDDMLLMEKIAVRYPGQVGYCFSPDALVTTDPVDSWRAFFQQRIRWASKAVQYRNPRMLPVLFLVYLVNLLLLLAGILSLFRPEGGLAWLGLMAWKTFVELLFLWPVAGFFGQRALLAWFPLAQPFHLLYTVIAGFFGQVRQYQWKGRTLR